jgi:hypothetical protein
MFDLHLKVSTKVNRTQKTLQDMKQFSLRSTYGRNFLVSFIGGKDDFLQRQKYLLTLCAQILFCILNVFSGNGELFLENLKIYVHT